MVPASVPPAPGPRGVHRAGAGFFLTGLVRIGVLAYLLSAAVASADGPRDLPVQWQRAFLVGTDGRAPATTEAVNVASMAGAGLYLVVEAERDGLPFYCTEAEELRIRGRAIPPRLIVPPAEAGLESREIHWVVIRPRPDARGWKRSRAPRGDGRWSISGRTLAELVGAEDHGYGTSRWAAAVSVPTPDGSRRVLPTPGFERTSEELDPERPPGLRLTARGSRMLVDRAMAFARLPVLEDATAEQLRNKIALRPVDLVLGAHEELGEGPLPGPRDQSITGQPWKWLFQRLQRDVRRRSGDDYPVVGSNSRGIRWAGQGPRADGKVRRGDVLVMEGGQYALLLDDDGDGWLGDGDGVVHTAQGEVHRGELHDVPGRAVTILRTRDFREFRTGLTEAGYGALGFDTHFSPDLFRACREFQRDQGLPPSGIPYRKTRDALDEFLKRMRRHDTPEAPGGP